MQVMSMTRRNLAAGHPNGAPTGDDCETAVAEFVSVTHLKPSLGSDLARRTLSGQALLSGVAQVRRIDPD